MSLYPSLVRRLEEEKIAEVVALPEEWVQTAIRETLGETQLDAYLQSPCEDFLNNGLDLE